jgi:hypothetical protein
VREQHRKKQLETANAKRPRPICLHDLVQLFLFVAVPILIAPGLLEAQASDTSKVPQGTTSPDYQPITKSGRTHWLVKSVVGPDSLAAGVVSAGWGTAFNNPPEYGSHFSGFAQRYGMRFPEVVMGNAIEAGLGAVWEEDPRYDRSGQGPLWQRLRHAATLTVLAHRGERTVAPAYARYAGIVGENLIAKGWRPDSESSINFALGQCALGFVGRFASNVFGEFWPDVHNKMRHR